MTRSSSTATLAVAPSTDTTVWAKFTALGQALRTEVLEADERIDGALTALVAGEHIAMIGSPGTAKTYLYVRIVKRITGVRSYRELMRKTMSPDLVFGAQSIVAMKNDEPVRFVTTGMLPEADMALLDEFPRTSDAINNGLLTILNEREFKNGEDMLPVPLKTAFLCANTLPVGEAEHDLEAFWDRVVMRFIVDLPVDRATWRAIARLRPEPNPAPLLDWSDVLAAQEAARALPITDECFDAIDEIRFRLLAEEHIVVTPRRIQQAQYVCAAWAWLQGADEVRAEHGEILSHMLWDQPEQRAAVDRIVAEVVSPDLRLAVTISDTVQAFEEPLAETLAMDAASRTGQVNELLDKFLAQREELDEFVPRATGRALRIAEAASAHLDSMQMQLVAAMGVNLKQLKGLMK